MTRAILAIIIALAILGALRFRRDSRAWLPYVDDNDWLMEMDPYIDSLAGSYRRSR